MSWENEDLLEILNLHMPNITSPLLPAFDDRALVGVIIYVCVFLVSSVGNLTVFVSMFRSKRRKSRITLLIIHLAVADLIVTFIMIPLEIFWRITVQWLAGNVACKILLFLRAFGLYLSSNVLVCISLDRYFAILHPLTVTNARSRGKTMLACAWLASFVYAIPQSFIFHTAAHPQFPDFTQCVSFGFFRSQSHETLYNFLCVVCMYFLPLSVITVTYPAIWWEIHQKSAERSGGRGSKDTGLRRSDDKVIERAKIRTLRMTIMIVVVFVVCWTPYVVLTLWYMFERDSAERINPWLQEGLFMMAASNSCMNPIVYGSYAIDFRKMCLDKLLRRARSPHVGHSLQTNCSNSRNICVGKHNALTSGNRIVTKQTESCSIHQKKNAQKLANEHFVRNHLLCIDYIPMMTFGATEQRSPTPPPPRRPPMGI